MKYLVAILAIYSGVAKAGPSEDCIRDTTFQESRGAPVEHVIAIGHNIINRSKRTGKSICRVAKAGYKQKVPPKGPLREAFSLLARGVLNGTISDNTAGADSYTDLKKPPVPGRITRRIAGKTFFVMTEIPYVR